MKKSILFICDWPDQVDNVKVLQTLLDKDFSENFEWKIWSCKKGEDTRLLYRWYCYAKGAIYAIKNRKNYHAIFIWQQMVGYILFEILSIFHLRFPEIIFFTFIYNSDTIFRNFKKHLVNNALRFSKAVIWPSLEMSKEVGRDFPQYGNKNHFTLMPVFDVIDITIPVDKELDEPYFRNGIFTAGKSERDFNVVVRAFRNTNIPVTIVCTDGYVFTESDITSNIRILRFSQVSPSQYYALAAQSFCILISVINEKSPCGLLLITFAMTNSIPIIATDSYAVKDFISNNANGILFKIGQNDEIRKSYEKLKVDEAFRNSLINNANKTVEEMSPGYFIERLLQIIQN